jgi:hypothetical protein
MNAVVPIAIAFRQFIIRLPQALACGIVFLHGRPAHHLERCPRRGLRQ